MCVQRGVNIGRVDVNIVWIAVVLFVGTLCGVAHYFILQGLEGSLGVPYTHASSWRAPKLLLIDSVIPGVAALLLYVVGHRYDKAAKFCWITCLLYMLVLVHAHQDEVSEVERVVTGIMSALPLAIMETYVGKRLIEKLPAEFLNRSLVQYILILFVVIFAVVVHVRSVAHRVEDAWSVSVNHFSQQIVRRFQQ
jgi:hypothetical protein